MKSITLPGTSITTSKLGFGCSNLLGVKTEEDAINLLACAHDTGVRHFDVAPYYGYGDAERVLGHFLRNRDRSKITITTKFGIQPPSGITRQRTLIRFARLVMRALPSRLRNLLRSQSKKTVKRGAFSVTDARKSLHSSLRLLDTDYVDFFLLHECTPEDCQSEELLQFMNEAQKAGKVKHFGIATEIGHTLRILDNTNEFAQVIQIENNIYCLNLNKVHSEDDRIICSYGSFYHRDEVFEAINSNPEAAELVCASVNQKEISKAIPMFMLAYSLHVNNWGPVIYSSTDPDHIRSNASIAELDIPQTALQRIEQLVQHGHDSDADLA